MIQIPTFETSFNEKLEYRMIVFSNISRIAGESAYDDLMVYKGKMKPNTKNQREILDTKLVFDFLKKNEITIQNIEWALSKFSFSFNDYKRERLKLCLNELAEKEPFDKATLLFMMIIQNKIFGSLSYKFAILLFNAILVQNKILPIIFYTYPMLSLCELIESGLTIECLKEILLNNFAKSIKYNTPHSLISCEKIIEKLNDLREELNIIYKVDKAFITGSFANGLYNEYSDLDIIIKMEDYSKLEEVEKYLENHLLIPVDVIAFNDPFTSYHDLITYRIEVF